MFFSYNKGKGEVNSRHFKTLLEFLANAMRQKMKQ